jgi:hypothetical protein
MQPPQVQFVMQPASSPGQPRPRFAKKTQKTCGILQIVLGVAAFILGIAVIPLETGGGLFAIGHGIWGAVFMIIAGTFGVVSVRTETTCPIVTCMVMSIFSSICGVCLFSISAAACAMDNVSLGYKRYGNGNVKWYGPSDPEAAIVVDSLGILVGMTEFVVAIVQSAVCCRTTCCAPRPAAPTAICIQSPYTGYPMRNTGYVQAMVVPGTVASPAVGTPIMMQRSAMGVTIMSHPPAGTPITQPPFAGAPTMMQPQPPAVGAPTMMQPQSPTPGAPTMMMPPQPVLGGATGMMQPPPAYVQSSSPPTTYQEKSPL